MAKKINKKNDHRVEFNLSDFFVDKLRFENNKLYFGTDTRLYEVAELIHENPNNLAIFLGINMGIDHILDDEQVAEIALHKNFDFEKVDDVSAENVVLKITKLLRKKTDWPVEAHVQKRTPVYTIMGHVDHGKTTLLDVIRKSNLTAKEAGGITQTIGAYQIEHNGQSMTFIDTPGHAAFTAMRANGSKVTDVAIILVAADDSIMPQTKESIDHALAANVPIVVAINKMDMPGANPNKVKDDLALHGVVVEDLGGQVPAVEISALKEENIDKLLDILLLQADILDLETPVNILGAGSVIESNLHKQKGNLVSILVQTGTIKQGDAIIIDDFRATIKAMHNDLGNPVLEAEPGTPVELYGLGAAPLVGSKFVVIKDTKEADKITSTIHDARMNMLRKVEKPSAIDLFAKLDNNKKQFNIILKADGLGVLQALETKILSFSNDEFDINIVRKDVGEITDTDITLADASHASIYTFNQKIPQRLEQQIKSRGINVFSFDIIYKLFEDIEAKLLGLADDIFLENKIGSAEIIQIFSFSKVGKIAGCIVRDGKIVQNTIVKIFRNEKLIFEGEIASLRVMKEHVKEVTTGKECGISIRDYNDFLVGDKLEVYELVKQ